jgi:hypothetical protein
MIETYLVHSALELKSRQGRVTMADQTMEDQTIRFLKAPPQTRYFVAPQRQLRPWRKRIAAAPRLRPGA